MMRSVIVGFVLFGQASTTLAQGEEPVPPVPEPTAVPAGEAPAPAVTGARATRVQVGVAFLPMLLGTVATGPIGNATSSNLDSTYGVGLSFGYRVVKGLSVGVAPQVVFHLSSKDSAGYTVIDSEKEYDLMARIAYAYAVVPKLDVYAEVLPGYSLVTYNKIILGVQAPNAKGIVLGGGLGAAFAITDRLFANVGVGYQLGFQKSFGLSHNDVKTKFLRIALGGGVKF
jgi:opacity protein-like surface antigen